ncbi:MAG: alkaline phosphatase family protein, partial [Actinomycetota bacterium]|nr:alkaline phosphatase family protein [Actinomycetota bacterium]
MVTSTRIAAALVACLVLSGCVSSEKEGTDDDFRRVEPRAAFDTNDPVERACALDAAILRRITRGHHPDLSEDVVFVPREPNFVGTFDFTSHSGPWDYLQNIPLVLYGPGHVVASGAPVTAPARTVDVYPTVAELVGADVEPRDGRVLDEAVVEGAGPPRLVVVVVWDGAGRNTLERWPERWPNLARLEREGTSYLDAVVGSSPSVTSAVHSSLGTGVFPRTHLVTGNQVRGASGSLVDVYAGNDADDLKPSTFADQIDAAFDNESRVGLLGWKNWHIGMMGHGAALPGGDLDELALLRYGEGVEVDGNPDAFRTPFFPAEVLDVEDEIASVDRADGAIDEKWLGHDIGVEPGNSSWDLYSNPAWAEFQTEVALWMLREGGYGEDEVPDFFFTNFKMTDLAGHQWSIDGRETAAVLEAQDRALGEIVDFLDEEVGDYVVVLTSDHGHSPSPASTGAWPIVQEELIADLDAAFDVPDDESLVEDSAAWGLFLDLELMDELDIAATDVATFINAYTIEDNWPSDELPSAFSGRAEEQVFSAAFAGDQLGEIMRCA